ncbi:DUF4123 domain-containing protein [uncultured Tateyamaria sp.]|uniref:DUF4123 domain-containing protein n=1 Tax=Tateyamaria sp. 1078 TaxID=3417464 RepID=UPI0026216816|nr:DUF4123 domain-containing protein [uncultured Tateyamaria sp.]
MVLAAGAGPVSSADILKDAGAPLWTIIDGASCPEMPQLVHDNGGVCLYRADTPEDAPHAPWLIPVLPDTPIADDLDVLGNIEHWGIVFASDASERELRNHFRKFTMLWTPADEHAPVYFRFYDPRVLGDAMQALDADHLAHLLAPVLRLWVPVSPLLGGWTGLTPLAAPDVFRGHFLELAMPEGPAPAHPKAFSVLEAAYAEMTRLHGVRSRRKLARDLHTRFPNAPEQVVMTCAQLAPEKAPAYGLQSLKHIGYFADAMMVFGPEFDTREAEAAAILNRAEPVSLTKATALRDWFEQARAAKRARGKTVAPGALA